MADWIGEQEPLMPEPQSSKPVGSPDWWGRSVSTTSLGITILLFIGAALAGYSAFQVRMASLEYKADISIADRMAMHTQIDSLKSVQQAQFESINLHLAHIDEKLDRLAEQQAKRDSK